MNLLILDSSAEAQQFLVSKIDNFSSSDIEMLDIRMKLATPQNYLELLEGADVVLLGSGLGQESPVIARTIAAHKPWLNVVMFVTDEYYSGGAFRAAVSAGVRKVFRDDSSPLDLLQELVGVFHEFRREGKVREGKIVCITQAKGGTGATTLAASLGEICSIHQKKTVLWDLDIESRDLSRSLTAASNSAQVVSSWINGDEELSRITLEKALTNITEDVSVLSPPLGMAESMDMVCHTHGMQIAQKVLDLSRSVNDAVIIDLAGRLSPTTGALIRSADHVIIVIDDTVLGLSALDLYLTYVKQLVLSPDKISFVVNGFSGSLLGVSQIQSALEPSHKLGDKPWRLPPIPIDRKGGTWPGSGKGFFSLSQKGTRSALETIIAEIGLVRFDNMEYTEDEEDDKKSKWWNVFNKKDGTQKQTAQPQKYLGHTPEDD